jgi:hypothetical protein
MQGHVVDLAAGCLGPHEVVACGARARLDGGGTACGFLTAVGCYTRPSADGGVETFLTDETGGAYPADVRACTDDERTRASSFSACGP